MPKVAATLTLLATLSLAPCAARAQMADSLASVNSELYVPGRDANEPSRKIGFYVLRANVMVPMHVADKTVLLPGIKYEQTSVLFDGTPETPGPVLRMAAISMGVAQGIGESWTVIGIASVGVASDFAQPLSGEDFVFTGTALALYKISPALSLGAGVSYDQRTGAPLPLPSLLLNWRASENFRVRGFVPSRVDAEYRVARWFATGVAATFNGDRYALSEQRYGQQNLQVAFSTAEIGPRLTFSATDWVHVDLYGAVPVFRRYDVYQSGSKIEGASLPIVPAIGVKLRIGPSMWNPPARP